MVHICYIIYSKTIDSYYVGETSDIETRLEQHNNGFFESSFTRRANDWELFVRIEWYKYNSGKKD
jgi:putative endonuclease